jgi:hypothetical protein
VVTHIGLAAAHERDRLALANAAGRAGIHVVPLTTDPRSVVAASMTTGLVAWRAPGGLLGAAIGLGAPISLFGATPEWFASLPLEVTGRRWLLVEPGRRVHMPGDNQRSSSSPALWSAASQPAGTARRKSSPKRLLRWLRRAPCACW